METTWILICDASRARILSFDHEHEPWGVVEEHGNPEGRARGRDLASDREGRTRLAGRGGQGSMEPGRDPTSIEARRFARFLAGRLEQGFDEHRYARLVLVTSPRFLGLLRKTLSDPVARLVAVTVAKSLTRANTRDIRAHLECRL
jgi:protein required for attachment to host cells